MSNILIVGVGGQGTLLASKIIGNAAIQMGYDVKVSEVHGMAQRGGSVVTYVKYADSAVQSPIIERGEADIILAFELLEGYRFSPYLKKDGRVIVNTQEILPMPVISGAAAYPANILEKLASIGVKTEAFNAVDVAIEAGNEKCVNVAMIGKMARQMSIPKDVWVDVLRTAVKPAFLNVNMAAFLLAYGE